MPSKNGKKQQAPYSSLVTNSLLLELKTVQLGVLHLKSQAHDLAGEISHVRVALPGEQWAMPKPRTGFFGASVSPTL
jgi:hypothetical protein